MDGTLSSFYIFHLSENVTHVTASCSESGIWQPIDFECVFDPLAVNLKEKAANFGKMTYKDCNGIANHNGSMPSSISDWAFTGGQGTGTLVTLSVLGTLVFIVILLIVAFFTQRKCFTPEDSNSTPKISRSSTNQLIADVANGLVAHIDGPEPNKDPEGSGNLYLNHYDELTTGAALGTFRPNTNGLRRSAGDGGSVVDENNYSSLKNLHDPELDIEESHYAMVRQPDGRADEPTYSSLK